MNEEVRAAGVKQEVRVVLVDAGYYSEENVLKADPEGPDVLLATSRDRQATASDEGGFCPRGRIPNKPTAKDLPAAGRADGAKAFNETREGAVEVTFKDGGAVFGQIKEARCCNRFMRRGFTPAMVNGR